MTPHDDLIARLHDVYGKSQVVLDVEAAIAALVAELDKLATLLHSSTRLIDQYQSEREETFAERDEARTHGVEARLREKAAEDARVSAVDRAARAEAERDAAHALLVGLLSDGLRRIIDATGYPPMDHLDAMERLGWIEFVIDDLGGDWFPTGVGRAVLDSIDALLAEKEGTT
jgi:hypothetical protein